METLLARIVDECRPLAREGKVASYIPELAKGDPDALGIAVVDREGREWSAGDAGLPFTIQSISKVVTLLLAIADLGWERVSWKVGAEPTADAFNSIINLETKSPEKPLNPMINAGAIATAALVRGADAPEAFERILDFTRRLAGNPGIRVDEAAFRCERATGHRNRALAHFMRSTGAMDRDVDEVLEVYFRQCAVQVNCRDIARIGAVLAFDGVAPWSGERLVVREAARIAKSIMVTCGLYDGSGDFAVRVGVPAKSGVGGGILAAAPRRFGLGVMGPALDSRGNSVAGLRVLERLSEELELSIF
jgi:glutaminase